MFACKKSVCLKKNTSLKKALVACNFFVPSILLKADVKAQQALI
jgi:hypothetical protein